MTRLKPDVPWPFSVLILTLNEERDLPRCLESVAGCADVVVYDYLSNPTLLRHARPDAEVIYVGKQASSHTVPQDEINALLVKQGKAGKIVTAVCRAVRRPRGIPRTASSGAGPRPGLTTSTSSSWSRGSGKDERGSADGR